MQKQVFWITHLAFFELLTDQGKGAGALPVKIRFTYPIIMKLGTVIP